MLENGKKQNCPIDDEGLRFIMAREHRTQKLHPFPTDEHQNVNFFLVNTTAAVREREHTLRRFLVMCRAARKNRGVGAAGRMDEWVGEGCVYVCSEKANVQIVNP